jgi:hypothetical protein
MRASSSVTLAVILAAFAAACSSGSNGLYCAGINNPVVLTLTNVTPAAGASVPNAAIVHSFSVTNDIAFEDIALSYTALHTAGDPTPAIAFTYTVAAESTDYTSTPVTWATAPAHVDLEAPIVYQTPDGCGYALPSPLFSYDVTGPVMGTP